MGRGRQGHGPRQHDVAQARRRRSVRRLSGHELPEDISNFTKTSAKNWSARG
jgi:hypothetical protein